MRQFSHAPSGARRFCTVTVPLAGAPFAVFTVPLYVTEVSTATAELDRPRLTTHGSGALTCRSRTTLTPVRFAPPSPGMRARNCQSRGALVMTTASE